MEVLYSADTPDIDRPAHDAAAERGEKSVRLRLQPNLLRGRNYIVWPGVSWVVECKDADDAIAVREALREFFALLKQCGPVDTRAILASAAEEYAQQSPELITAGG